MSSPIKKTSTSEPVEVTAPGAPGGSKERSGARAEPIKKTRKRKEKQAKQPAESVLIDPRTLETRAALIRGCGMEAERAKFDKEFEAETARQARARAHSDSSNNDTGEEEKDEKAKKKKKKKDDEVKEKFQNEGKTADSPNAKSPEASSALLEEMDFDLRVMELTHVKKLTTWKLASVLLYNFYRLPIFLVIAKYYATYGVSFIGLCGLIMAFIGIPVIFLELSMGTFTSLPPNTFFARMTPIAQGLGLSMMVLRLFALFCVHVDIRYLFLFIQHVALASSQNDDRCTEAGMPFCRTEKMCAEGELPGLYGACIKPTGAEVPFKDEMLGKVLEIRALQTSPSALLVQMELSEHNVYTIFSYMLVFLISGLPLIDGAEIFSKIAPVAVFSAFLTPFVIFFNLEGNEDFSVLRAGWNGDMDAFSDPFAWIVAFCLMCSMFNVGEGTWMFIGSWLNFRHRQVVRTLLITVAAQLLLMLLMSFALTAWAATVVHYQHNGYLTHNEVLEILRDRPLQFWFALPIKVIPDKRESYMFITYLLFTIGSLGYVATTGEYLIVSLIRGLPFLVRVPNVQLRGTLLLMIIGVASIIVPFTMDMHIFENARVHYAFLAMMLIVIFYEMMIFVYIYGLQRVLVNLKVLFRSSPTDLILYSRATNYLKVCYRFIVPWILMCGYAYATYYLDGNGVSMLNAIVSIVHTAPFIVGAYKAARHSETTHHLVTLFRPDSRFGPAAVNFRKEAQTEENKMGSYGMD